MKVFNLDKSYECIKFEDISVEDLIVISGGSGGGSGGGIFAEIVRSVFPSPISDLIIAVYGSQRGSLG